MIRRRGLADLTDAECQRIESLYVDQGYSAEDTAARSQISVKLVYEHLHKVKKIRPRNLAGRRKGHPWKLANNATFAERQAIEHTQQRVSAKGITIKLGDGPKCCRLCGISTEWVADSNEAPCCTRCSRERSKSELDHPRR